MRTIRRFAVVGASLMLTTAWANAAEVKIAGVHNCCGACCKAIVDALGKVEGISDVTAKPKETDFTFQAADEDAAKKAVAALARAGFHGSADGKDFRDNSRVKKGKVQSLELVGVHNCCPGCCKAIKETLKSVDGVTGDTVEPKKRAFVVEGDFDAQAIVSALNEAGFHARLKPANGDRAKKKRKKKADN